MGSWVDGKGDSKDAKAHLEGEKTPRKNFTWGEGVFRSRGKQTT